MELNELARDALDTCRGDVAGGAKMLAEAARKSDRVLRVIITDQMIQAAAYDAVRAICRQDRRKIWMSPNYDQGGNGERVAQHADSLLDFPLPGGLRLRDATAAEVMDAAGFYTRQAEQMQHVAAWLQRIGDMMGRSKKRVGDKLTGEKLAELQREVQSC